MDRDLWPHTDRNRDLLDTVLTRHNRTDPPVAQAVGVDPDRGSQGGDQSEFRTAKSERYERSQDQTPLTLSISFASCHRAAVVAWCRDRPSGSGEVKGATDVTAWG
jgi:hypothetical protein